MLALWHSIENWSSQYQGFWYWVGGISLFLFVASILALPWLVSLIPNDYFSKPRTKPSLKDFSINKLIVFIIKNIIGVLLIFFGLLMLILPGQGIITIIAGIILTNFPGKFALEKWLIKQEKIYTMINWLRAKRGKQALQKPSL